MNDSKATNVESALRSIESFDRDLVPIIGGRFKGGDFGLLREPLRTRAKAVVAIGEARTLVREALERRRDGPRSGVLRRRRSLVRTRIAKPAGVVLLAPACASFDMFHDYAERGRAFKEEVARITRGGHDMRTLTVVLREQ